MDDITKQRWFGITEGLSDPFVKWCAISIGGLILVSYLLTLILSKTGKIGSSRRSELISRLKTWVILAAVIMVPIIAGAFWTILALFLLSIVCYREFATITGLFRNYIVSAAVVVGTVAIFVAVFDHWYGFFSALPSLGVALILTLGVLSDRPKGYLQRIALAITAFLMFGVALGHIGYVANDPGYRAYLLLFIIAVELNDVFAYLSGNLFGKKKLCPSTSPNKTVGGAVGAIMGTTALVWILGTFVFEGTLMDSLPVLIGLGVLISVTGQLGDLVVSSVKRDLGIKDTGKLLPGHGGVLDRFDSLLIAGPAYFHYVGYFIGFGLDEPVRIFSGGGG